ncbi:hypothetical protein RJ55_02769 [Drechmeria coniospora]|nr:hypothetical protein RJ55_02769 [Drechmeria coniospora]
MPCCRRTRYRWRPPRSLPPLPNKLASTAGKPISVPTGLQGHRRGPSFLTELDVRAWYHGCYLCLLCTPTNGHGNTVVAFVPGISRCEDGELEPGELGAASPALGHGTAQRSPEAIKTPLAGPSSVLPTRKMRAGTVMPAAIEHLGNPTHSVWWTRRRRRATQPMEHSTRPK